MIFFHIAKDMLLANFLNTTNEQTLCSLGLSATSQQTSHQQPVNNTFLSEQISTSHQPPAKRTS
jgi:hypothetical protein